MCVIEKIDLIQYGMSYFEQNGISTGVPLGTCNERVNPELRFNKILVYNILLDNKSEMCIYLLS